METGPIIFLILLIAAGVVCIVVASKDSDTSKAMKNAPDATKNNTDGGKPVWLRGKVYTRKPLTLPELGYNCVYYSCRCEESTRPYHNTFVIKDSEEKHSTFFIRAGRLKIEVNSSDGKLYDLSHNIFHGDFYRYVIYFISANAELSIFGVLSDDKKSINPWGELPMVITTRGRESFIKSFDAESKWMRKLGIGLILFAIVAFVLLMFK